MLARKSYVENTTRAYLNRLVVQESSKKRKISGDHCFLNLEQYRIL
ncbi:hypothetical protein J0A67_18630 [Algoriphagus aestuariicola]|uniref:Uncharacterized protein n=1 Tax=Algoriphagus aestuariicola TaxID=1852016 RepID=A0ABS3BUB6_9BACT|nr:hypothetical protein [Algoriphagus aestuariicola]MBN7802900.1 hypothetical protein [Algoriphagus aestuariicola]